MQIAQGTCTDHNYNRSRGKVCISTDRLRRHVGYPEFLGVGWQVPPIDRFTSQQKGQALGMLL